MSLVEASHDGLHLTNRQAVCIVNHMLETPIDSGPDTVSATTRTGAGAPGNAFSAFWLKALTEPTSIQRKSVT
jgi:hypothetical protein